MCLLYLAHRWDPGQPATADNLVLLTQQEADDHDQLASLEGLSREEPHLVARVEAGLDRVRRELFY